MREVNRTVEGNYIVISAFSADIFDKNGAYMWSVCEENCLVFLDRKALTENEMLAAS